MSKQAKSLAPAEAAAAAVKAYIRMHRSQLAADGELLALLVPDRGDLGEVRDLQRFVIDRLATENAALKAELEAVRGSKTASVRMSEGVRRFVLDLIDARSFSEAIAVAVAAAPAFGADRAAICVEGDGGAHATRSEGVRLIAPGTTNAVLGSEGMGAILPGGGELLLGGGGGECRSLAAFRLKLGASAPAALFVLGALEPAVFEGEDVAADLRYVARALERAIRAWLDLPKI